MRWRVLKLARIVFLLLAADVMCTCTLLGAEVPVVLQPGDDSFTAADRAAIAAGTAELDQVLREGYPVPTFRLNGWMDADFAVFVAGYLGSSGYEAVVVEGSGPSGGEHRVWVLAKFVLEGGVLWVPIEVAPSVVGTSARLGIVAWSDGQQTEFGSSYTNFDRVVELASHPAPTVKISVSAQPVAGVSAPIHALSTASPVIIAYVWTIEGDDLVYVETNAATFRYTFPAAGAHNVSLTVYDRWGNRGTDTKEVDVSDEGFSCGCHH
jgi:hypothetical protein